VKSQISNQSSASVSIPAVDTSPAFAFDNSYARLPAPFFVRHEPTVMPSPQLIRFNHVLAQQLGLDANELDSPIGTAIFTGSCIPAGAAPLSMAYAGHQFGGYAPILGDGRAVLLGEVLGVDGVRRDIQLKGAGRTPFSRGGDGRAALGPVLREYILCESMHALGVPTTRALAATLTGETVIRERRYPGAMFTRVARSHVRIGTFQYFAAHDDQPSVRALANYVLHRHYPQAAASSLPYDGLFAAVLEAQANLVARWMQVGFIHGVMNTDNMQVAGETIDYGPCAFMDTYDPDTVYSSIDHQGRYAYANQPLAAHWNLAWLARSLLPCMDDDPAAAAERAQAISDQFPIQFEHAWLAGMRAKIGLAQAEDTDRELIQSLLDHMHQQHADFTLTFRRLSSLASTTSNADPLVNQLFDDPAAFDAWALEWRARLAREGSQDGERQSAMRAVNPAVIPRNHRVEEAIQAALGGDFSVFETLLAVLAAPFTDDPQHERFTLPPMSHEVVQQTFCGT
jgi:uncharacterized protein YdiU (UPF0061 family)